MADGAPAPGDDDDAAVASLLPLSGEATTRALTAWERAEVLALSVCVTYAASFEVDAAAGSSGHVGYWGKKTLFALSVAALFIAHRLDHGSTAYLLDPEPWRGAFLFLVSFGWFFTAYAAPRQVNFVFRTGLGVLAFLARYMFARRIARALRRQREALARRPGR